MVVSSHVLHEVQSLTPNIMLLNHGRLLAEGQVRQIRDLIDKHPHHIVLGLRRLPKTRGTAGGWEDVEGIQILAGEKGDRSWRHARLTRFTAGCRSCRWKTGRRSAKSIPMMTIWKPSSNIW